MMYVSFVEILQKGVGSFETVSEKYAVVYATLSFFLGVAFMVGCDKIVHRLESASYQRSGEAKVVMQKNDGCCEVKVRRRRGRGRGRRRRSNECMSSYVLLSHTHFPSLSLSLVACCR